MESHSPYSQFLTLTDLMSLNDSSDSTASEGSKYSPMQNLDKVCCMLCTYVII